MFVIELNPQSLVYLTKMLDAPTVTVRSEDVMLHAQIRQQLAQPKLSSELVAELKAQGAQEAANKNRTLPPSDTFEQVIQ